MFKWIREMDPFLETNMSALLARHSLTNASQIGDRHPAAKEMAYYLQNLENAMAKQLGRQAIKVTLSSPSTAECWDDANPDKRQVYYNFQSNYYHFVWYPNECALGYILKFIHECTHANQNLNCAITSDEFKLAATERACLKYTEDQCYWSQYTEITARIAEAEAWLQLTTKYNEKFTLSELEQLERYGRNLVERITLNVTKENVELLKKIQQQCFDTKKYRKAPLKAAFPHAFWKPISDEASAFLANEQTNALHKQAIDKAFQRKKEIQDVLKDLQKQIVDQQEQILCVKMQQKEQEMQHLSQQYNVPFTNSISFPPPPFLKSIELGTDVEVLILQNREMYTLFFGQVEIGGIATWYLMGEPKLQTTNMEDNLIDDEFDTFDDDMEL